jgi:parallel beta helix pectate lyase-like protein
MKKNILSFCMLLLLFISTSVAAEEATTLFEQKYLRTSGAPNVYTDTFSAAAGDGMLIIKNGSWNGKKRIVKAIRSASIFINGEQVFGRRHFKNWFRLLKKSINGRRNFCPRYFKKRVHLLEIPVNLREGDNEISIKLAGRRGSYLTLMVIGKEFKVKHNLPTTKGTLTGDETWSGEVEITGDVVVPQGVTLTINPDTVVSFSALNDEEAGGSDVSLCELIIEGSLVAKGSDDQQVRFTSSNTTNPTAGDWYGIVAQPSSGLASINLSGCTVEYANFGIKAVTTEQDVSLTVTDSFVQHSSSDGFNIYAESGSVITLDINNTQITDNGGWGIQIQDDNSQLNGGITDSTIADNDGYGLYVYLTNSAMSDLGITGNTIYGNQFGGIFTIIQYCDSNESRFNINNNTIYNSGIGIYCSAVSGRITADITENEVYNGTYGIYCFAYASTFSAVIADNSIHDNAGAGISCNKGSDIDHLDPTITLNNVYSNGGDGIYCWASGPVDVLNNDSYDNSGRGLYLKAGNGSNVNYNNIYDNNGSYDLENGNLYTINGHYNFWGTSTTAEMASGVNPKNITRIYDNYDDSAIGTVDYANWFNDDIVK